MKLVETLLLLLPTAAAFSAQRPVSASPMFEYLKWGGSQPDFDVIAKTKEFVQLASEGTLDESMIDKDFVFRGPLVGPLTRKELVDDLKGFDLSSAFPDAKGDSFGFTIDPENPYRCFYFLRTRATHTGPLVLGQQKFEPTGKKMETPVSVYSLVWTPAQKVIYQQIGSTVDRFEGNTQGLSAAFAYFHTAGLKLPGAVGSLPLRLVQRLGHLLGNGRSFSKEEDIPKWWKSKSRGADPTDQF